MPLPFPLFRLSFVGSSFCFFFVGVVCLTASRNATSGAAVDELVVLLGVRLAGADVGAAFFLFFRGAGVGAMGASAAFGVGPTEVLGRLIGV